MLWFCSIIEMTSLATKILEIPEGKMKMAGTWITDITHFLDEKGEMITEPPP
jgi:hypothetical protein